MLTIGCALLLLMPRLHKKRKAFSAKKSGYVRLHKLAFWGEEGKNLNLHFEERRGKTCVLRVDTYGYINLHFTPLTVRSSLSAKMSGYKWLHKLISCLVKSEFNHINSNTVLVFLRYCRRCSLKLRKSMQFLLIFLDAIAIYR